MKLYTGKVLENKALSKDTFLLKLYLKNFQKPFPTQFVLVDTYPYRFLLKPFTIVEYKKNVLSLIYRIISDGTKYLSSLTRNANLNLLGPFGNHKKIAKLEIKNSDHISFVAGGSGIASIISLYHYISNFTDNIEVFYGERSKSYIVNLKQFNIKNVTYTTEDGSYGNRGTVVDIFISRYSSNQYPNYVFVCGPKAMLSKLKEVTSVFYGTKIFVLMEEYMCCGIGLCRSCVVKIKHNKDIKLETVCKDGPMFELQSVLLC